MDRVLVTVVEVLGSAPREVGAWMIVGAGGTTGTIGGGALEERAIATARAMLADRQAPPRRRLALPLGPALAQCCGGQVVLELARDAAAVAEHDRRMAAARARQPLVALFGAGHVGAAVARALQPLPFRLLVVDDRPERLELPVETKLVPRPAEAVATLPSGAVVLVMTHSHPLDLDIVEAALRRPGLAWVGLIGSASKRARFASQLRGRGVPRAAIERLVCPIGIGGITGNAPEVIAASVAAQLLIVAEAFAARNLLASAAS